MFHLFHAHQSGGAAPRELAAEEAAPEVAARAAELLRGHQQSIWRRTDHLFAGLLMFEWLGGIVLAAWRTPRTWNGTVSQIHPHLFAAVFLGAAIIAFPIYAALAHPGRTFTRHVMGIGQMLSCALLIHLGDGRIEMHFQIFGALAFLAFYRDWRVLVSASLVVAADHLLRGIYLPESIYGVLTVTYWRTLEHAGWVVFEDVFLIASCIQGVREMHGIAERQALLEHSQQTTEAKVRERTRELQDAQQNLIKVARSAGMAEIATSVLHNVGNVLNSLNVSVNVAAGKVETSPVRDLAKAVGMMAEHKDDLGRFLSEDRHGKQIPDFLAAVAQVMVEEQSALLAEIGSLSKNVDHIKRIVSVQQSHAKAESGGDAATEVRIAELVRDAASVNAISQESGGIEFASDIEDITLWADKHALLQILINVIRNAKHAVMTNSAGDRRIAVKAGACMRGERRWMRLEVTDNGVGIEPANLTRIFNHGFTTKADGHGFGLHSAANAAKQMRGSLTATSRGRGQGASFILELPMDSKQVAA